MKIFFCTRFKGSKMVKNHLFSKKIFGALSRFQERRELFAGLIRGPAFSEDMNALLVSWVHLG